MAQRTLRATTLNQAAFDSHDPRRRTLFTRRDHPPTCSPNRRRLALRARDVMRNGELANESDVGRPAREMSVISCACMEPRRQDPRLALVTEGVVEMYECAGIG